MSNDLKSSWSLEGRVYLVTGGTKGKEDINHEYIFGCGGTHTSFPIALYVQGLDLRQHDLSWLMEQKEFSFVPETKLTVQTLSKN